MDVHTAAVKLANELDNPLGKSGLQPDEFGIAAPEPGRIDANDVLQAAYGQVETLPVGGRAALTHGRERTDAARSSR